MERLATEAERASIKYKQVEFMSDKIEWNLKALFPVSQNGASMSK